MWDARLRKAVDPFLNPIAGMLIRMGSSANLITMIGFGFGIAAWIALACRFDLVALILIVINRLLDGLDGLVARQSHPTDLGGFLDIVFDFLFYSGVPFFFAVGRPEFALPAAFLIFSFVGTGSSFLAFAAIAAKQQSGQMESTSLPTPNKAIHYLGGLTEGMETILLFVSICLFPEWFDLCAWTFGGLCWLTTLTRIYSGVQAFGKSTRKEPIKDKIDEQ